MYNSPKYYIAIQYSGENVNEGCRDVNMILKKANAKYRILNKLLLVSLQMLKTFKLYENNRSLFSQVLISFL